MVTPAGEALDSFQLAKPLPPRPVERALTAEHSRGPRPLEVLLSAQTTLPEATFQWDFGDGQTAQGQNVSHVYASPGSYTVTVTASAGSHVLTQSLTVTPQAASTPSPSAPESGDGTSPPPSSRPGTPSAPAPEPSPQAGCSSAGAGGWLLLGAPLAWVLARRRRRE
jgi:PKD repeat protein